MIPSGTSHWLTKLADYIHKNETRVLHARGRKSLTKLTRTKIAEYIDTYDTLGTQSFGLLARIWQAATDAVDTIPDDDSIADDIVAHQNL
jgi:hypothetical protein